MRCFQPGLAFSSLLVLLVAACGPSKLGDDDGGGGADAGPLDTDDDGDGYTENDGDCNDADPTVHPGASENCTDGIDNNCNGDLDGDDYLCLSPCDRAAADRSSVGCVYYAIDANPMMPGAYAVAVSNVDAGLTANVIVEQKTGTTWAAVAGGTFTVGPRSLYTLTLPHRTVSGSALYAGGAYRITSDLPVIAYQFSPIDGSASYLSDASLLLPKSALDRVHIVDAWPYGPADTAPSSGWPAHLQVIATEPTNVTITSPITTTAGTGVPAFAPGVPQTIAMDEGDFIQLTVQNFMESFAGAYVDSDKPVAVFSTNECANVPAQGDTACCCEHLEEQIFGLQTWGTSYVGAQMPRRQQEGSIWHIVAQQDGTTLTFAASPEVTGLPAAPVVLNARQRVEYEVRGATNPGDFLVTSDKPIHVNQYTVGCYYVQYGSTLGDPDMVQAVPTEQYLDHYVVLAPSTWINDFLVLIRKAGTDVQVDGASVTTGWTPVGTTPWETARVSIADGVHVLDGAQPFGVSVSGYDDFDSYSYPGGLNQTIINPVP